MPTPLTFDLLDDNVQTFFLPAEMGINEPFIIKCGDAVGRITLGEVMEAQGVVILSADDGTQIRIVLEQFAQSDGPREEALRTEPATDNVWIGGTSAQLAEVPSAGAVVYSTSVVPALHPLPAAAIFDRPPTGNHIPSRQGQKFFQTFVWNIHAAPCTHNSFQPLTGLMSHTAVVDPKSGHVYAFGGSNGKGEENELYAYNQSVGQWRRIENSYRPWGRHGHVSVAFEGHMYIMGGIGHNGVIPTRNNPPVADETSLFCNGYRHAPRGVPIGFLADMWSYNFETSTWKNVANSPAMLFAFHSACVTEDGQIFAIGGLSSDSKSTSSVQVAHVPVRCSTSTCARMAVIHVPEMGMHYCAECQNTLRTVSVRSIPQNSFAWQKVNSNGATFAPRHKHTGVISGNNIIVFGGRNETDGILGDLLVLNLQTMTWVVKPRTAEFPEPREGHAACVTRNTMFLVGGQGALEKKTMGRRANSAPRQKTSPLADHAGSISQPHQFADAYMLDLVTFQWRNLNLCSNITKGLSQHVLLHTSTTQKIDEPSRSSFLCFGGRVQNTSLLPPRQTFHLEGQHKTVKSKKQEENEAAPKVATEMFDKFYTRQMSWAQKVNNEVLKERKAADDGSITEVIATGLFNANEAALKSLATEVRGIKLSLAGLKETIREQIEVKALKEKVTGFVDDITRYVGELSNALSFPDAHKTALTQSNLTALFTKIDNQFIASVDALKVDATADAAKSAEVRESLTEELTSTKKELNASRKQVAAMFKEMTTAGVKHMVSYVKKHELAIHKSTIKVTENFKSSMWSGALNCGYKMYTKDMKKEEEQWAKQRVSRLQQSFPHLLPKDCLDEMSRCIEAAVVLADGALVIFEGDPKETSKEALARVKATRHAAQVLRSLLEKENVRLKDSLTFRQALFFSKFREYEKEADAMKLFVKDNVQNLEAAEEGVRKIHKRMLAFKKAMTTSCDKIVLVAAQSMYKQGMDIVKARQDTYKKAYGVVNKEGRKGDDTPTVGALRTALGLPQLPPSKDKDEEKKKI